MNKRERVKALCDMFTDSHAEIMAHMAKYNVDQLESECMEGARDQIKKRWAKNHLRWGIELLRAQAARALRIADELETLL